MNNIYVIILCGGSGTRLWPLSRNQSPKQFLKFFDGNTLIQKSVDRALMLTSEKNIYFVTNYQQEIELKRNLEQYKNNDQFNILIEKYAKNTLPAILLALREIKKIDDNSSIVVLPSDHIFDDNLLLQALESSLKALNDDYGFSLIGIRPTYPSIGFGYIDTDFDNEIDKNTYKINCFYEKPNLANAKRFFNRGFLWNSGIFIFNLNFFISQFKDVDKDMYELFFKSNEKNFSSIDSISFDKGFVEKIDKYFVTLYSGKWNDLGSWNSIHSEGSKDKNDNVVLGDVSYLNCSNNLLYGDSKKIVCFGVDNLIVVNTNDVVMIINRDSVDDIKKFLEVLYPNDSLLLDQHPTVIRPWGEFTVLEEQDNFKIKKINVLPGRSLSLQSHKYRNEHWVVVKGKASVLRDGIELSLSENESTYISKNQKHRLSNKTDKELLLIEVQVGDYLGEDDIVRFEDNYGR